MTKQAIIYTRFSPRPDADTSRSCEKQEERCRTYCHHCGHEVVSIWADKSATGGILNRPGLQGALNLLAPGMVLIVDSSDRLARDMLVNLTIRHQVAEAGGAIEYANGAPAGTTPEGLLFQNILAAFSAYERDRIRLRTKQGLDKKRKNGERTTGKIPIGWKLDSKDPKRLVRCEKERRAIMWMCTYRRNGFTSEEIAQRLTREIGSCRGKPWSARTIRRLIKREAYWADPIDGNPNLEPSHP